MTDLSNRDEMCVFSACESLSNPLTFIGTATLRRCCKKQKHIHNKMNDHSRPAGVCDERERRRTMNTCDEGIIENHEQANSQ